ncbi:MAG: response regulator [Candidatus Polarisedimenticolaceae bacterium]|nr:response regulator [Candidatus Polarisedimenticolaceae bacterium]
MHNRRQRILVIDDNITNVELLEAYLCAADYEVITAYNGHSGLEMAITEAPDLLLLDIMMPGLDGYQVCTQLKNNEKTRFIPIIMITALTEIEDKIKGLNAGADDFLSKPFNKHELMARVRSLLRIKSLHDDLDSSEDIILTLALALEAKDPYTKGHSERVAALATDLAKAVGLSDRAQDRIHKAGILHDIGKIGVSGKVLSKKGALQGDEYEDVIAHPSIGATICQPLKSLSDIIPMIKHHHERYDGNGKPDGLMGEEIPLGARIISIADTYDAMTSTRPYRKAMQKEMALSIFESETNNGQWDQELVKHFIKIIAKQTSS